MEDFSIASVWEPFFNSEWIENDSQIEAIEKPYIQKIHIGVSISNDL